MLLDEIRKAGSAVCSVETVKVKPDLIGVTHRKGFVVCPQCKEAYPLEHGPICLGCRGDSPYLPKPGDESNPSKPALRAVPLEAAEGLHALCDMTEIIPGVQKGPAFKRHHRIAAEDICRLQKMGRQSVYVAEGNPDDPNWIHEDEAASAFARAMAGEGVGISKQPSEGKMEMFARQSGLFLVDAGRLEAFNLLAGMKCAARHGFTVTAEGTKLAGVRAIPLFLSRDEFEKGMKVLSAGPLFRVVPMRKARVGILVTGTEVFQGLVKDRFIPVIKKKVEAYGCSVEMSVITADDTRAISDNIRNLLSLNVDLIVTTAGLSVDPDDVTRQGLIDAGCRNLRYGAPILPGNMTLLADIESVQVIGAPACALYHNTTSFDLLLPRLLAGIQIGNKDLAQMGHGGMCLDCDICTFPDCTFGK